MLSSLFKKLRKIPTWVISVIFFIFIIIFIVIYFGSIDFNNFQDVSINWFYLILAAILGLGFRYFGAYIWYVLLTDLGAKISDSKIELTYIYAKSWLARYIPGPAPWMMSKIYFASKNGVSKNKLAVSSLLEGMLQIVVTIGLSLIFLLISGQFDLIGLNSRVLMIVAVISSLIVLQPRFFNGLIRLAYRLLKKKEMEHEHYASGKTIRKGASLYIFGAVLSGLSLFFAAKSIFPELGYDNLFFVMGVGNLAGAMGMLAIFVPSGIGVREGIQLVMLSLIMPKEIALLITIFTRIWGGVIDILFYAITSFVKSHMGRLSKK